MSKIVVEGLTKIFGHNPRRGLARLREGAGKEQLRRELGLVVGVWDVSFSVEPGEFFVIMGLSGSGKSTLLRCLNRLHEPTAGSIRIDGQEITALDRRSMVELRRRRFGMVFQRFALLPHRTVLSNVEFGLEVQGVPAARRREAAREALRLVGLGGWEDSFPHQLSGGMQQRVGLARALAVDPDILLMDEAFSALDPLIRREMQDELLELQARMNKTIVFITHDLDEALKLGDRIAVMRDGRLVQIGTPEQLVAEPADDYVAAFTQGVDRAKVLSAGAIMQPVKAVITDRDGPSTALHRMRQNGISSIFVLDRQRRVQGYLTVDDVVDAATHRRPLGDYLRRDFQAVTPDTRLDRVIPLGAAASVPIPVVDDGGRLRGVIVKGALLGALAASGGDSERGEDPERGVAS
ncbi:MAG: glycine betaine/L-proline ABC transporter ATP-binding protein [Firmicutes bacterium]|nr:glycine betaine/L-proline ABC transporter ATP-binding protein [Bacillota bacterium]